MTNSDGKHADITGLILKAFFKAYNELGYGFSEKVYENALAHEGRKLALTVEQQKEIAVYYDKVLVGHYFADLLVNGLVMVELKAVSKLRPAHEAQLLNYLKATPIEVGLLLNFGPKPEHQRKVYDNDRKGLLTWTDWKLPPATP